MTTTFKRLAALGLVLLTTALTPLAKADEWNKKTVITTNNPIQIQGKVLGPGQYVLRLLDSPSDRNIVQILDAHETKLEMTVLANSAFRLVPTGDTRFTFYETANGQAQALRTWFYPGDNFGLEFSAIR
jgi:hypothetical protein